MGTPAQVFLGLAGERELSIDAIMTLQNKLGSYNNDIMTAYGMNDGSGDPMTAYGMGGCPVEAPAWAAA